MLPCNVIVQEKVKGQVEVSAVDPAASMQAVESTWRNSNRNQRQAAKKVINTCSLVLTVPYSKSVASKMNN
jgi:uncharacterized protein (DUF302 family)